MSKLPRRAEPVTDLLACPDCDTLHRGGRPAQGRWLPRCSRCAAALWRPSSRMPDLPLALALSSLVLLLIAHLHPVLAINIQGREQQASLWQAAMTLYDEGAGAVSALVLLTTLLAPMAEALLLVWVLLPLRQGRAAPGARTLLHLAMRLRPWVMVEVFMLGVLVAAVKLSALASLEPGIGFWAFACAMLAVAATGQCFDPEQAWALLLAAAPSRGDGPKPDSRPRQR